MPGARHIGRSAFVVVALVAAASPTPLADAAYPQARPSAGRHCTATRVGVVTTPPAGGG